MSPHSDDANFSPNDPFLVVTAGDFHSVLGDFGDTFVRSDDDLIT